MDLFKRLLASSVIPLGLLLHLLLWHVLDGALQRLCVKGGVAGSWKDLGLILNQGHDTLCERVNGVCATLMDCLLAFHINLTL